MTDEYGDVEGAVRGWLRTHPDVQAVVGQRVFFGLPGGKQSCVTVAETGGAPDAQPPIDRPVLSFACWADYDAQARTVGTKAQARAVRDAVVTALMDLANVDTPGVRLLDATVLSSVFVPDDSTDPTCPRYLVDAEVRAVALTPT